jgi:hypothetical protein
MDFRSYRAVLVKLPPDVSTERYAAITHAIFSVLDAAGVARSSSVVNDRMASDAELNAAFDSYSEHYPWGS